MFKDEEGGRLWGWGWDLFGSAGNGFLNNLVAYWPGSELNGNALDLHTNALHLTDTNTVTSNPGWVYPLARQYTAANNEHHIRPGDDALLSVGVGIDLTMAVCHYLDSKPAGQMHAACKWAGGGNQRAYTLWWNNLLDRLEFTVSSTGAAAGNTSINNNSLGAPVLGTWYLTVVWHDATAGRIYIQTNDGAIDSVGHAGGVFDNTAAFGVGSQGGIACWDGRIGATMFWKSAAGLGGVKTPAERTLLWNDGTPLPYTSFTV